MASISHAVSADGSTILRQITFDVLVLALWSCVLGALFGGTARKVILSLWVSAFKLMFQLGEGLLRLTVSLLRHLLTR